MKKILLLLASAALVFSACNDDEIKIDSSSVSLSVETVNAEPEGGIYEVKVTSDSDWRVSGFCEWARVLNESGKSGDVLKIEVDPSDSKTQVETEFKVFSGSAVKAVKVISNPSYVLRLVSDPEVDYSSSSSMLSIKLDTNVPDIARTFTGNGSEWIEYEGSQEVFGNVVMKFNVHANETYVDRETELTLSGNGKTAVVKISQAQLDAIVTESPKVVYSGLGAGEVTFTVNANVDFTYELPSWLTLVSQTEGTKGPDGLTPYTIKLSFGENPASRVANLNFISDGKILLQVSVKQQNPDAVLFEISDAMLRQELQKKGWILSSEASTECELLEPGMTGEELDISSASYNALGVKAIDGLGNFPNLKTLTLGNLAAVTIDLSDCLKLETLNTNELTYLSNLNLGKCPVKTFKLYEGGMYSYDFFRTSSFTIISENLTEIVLNSESYYLMYYDSCEWIDVSACPVLNVLKAKREYIGWGEARPLKTIYVSQAQKDGIDAGTLTVEKAETTEIVVK